jgi:hypothetical protein
VTGGRPFLRRAIEGRLPALRTTKTSGAAGVRDDVSERRRLNALHDGYHRA